MKFIFVAGGVMSGVGKGVAAASIAKILQSKGYSITSIKIDPYVNVDAGTMNPVEHGEVFVTHDGMECDMDMGNYERFLNKNILATNYMTTGSVYKAIIDKERNLEYKGKCVSVVPMIPEEVIARIKRAGKLAKADMVVVEIGGTVGEYENILFLEAARMMRLREPKGVVFILVSFLPIPSKIGEMKTKPTQHAVRTLNSAGIQPDFILCRSTNPLDERRKEKISIFCNMLKDDVISAPDVESIYDVPVNFEKDELGKKILKKFGMKAKKTNMQNWREMAEIMKSSKKEVKIGIVGKYFKSGDFVLKDAYVSVIEAIKHAAWVNKRKPIIEWVDAGEFEETPLSPPFGGGGRRSGNSLLLDKGEVRRGSSINCLKNFDAIIVPGGFGERGVEGKIAAIKYARENKIPFLGLCLGMQMAVIEFARNVCGLSGANSTEINSKTKYPVIDIIEEQKEKMKNKNYGGSMRLGAYKCSLKSNTEALKAYKMTGRIINGENGENLVEERHRHRYEFNNGFRQKLEEKGLIISGINPEQNLVEIIELKDHPFFVGVQFHPEFLSRPLDPHPLFKELIKAAIK
ncbi:MAG: CTP synthase [bacterium]